MNDNNASAEFRSQTKEVVKSFLQSVVVLDDRAEMPLNRQHAAPLSSEPEFSPSSPAVNRVRRDRRGAPLDVNAVVDGFARIGSVCAVLKAAPSDSFREISVKAAQRADIVILDWVIDCLDEEGGNESDEADEENGDGDVALKIFCQILAGDHDSKRLRLIAFYTGEPILADIYYRVREAVRRCYGNQDLVETEDKFRISSGPLHVVILAKEDVHAARLSDSRLEDQRVTADKLADRLVDEFSEVVGGLICNAAIAGIAGVRDNVHRILAKFDPSLDPAYLGHRLLLPYSPDAEDHLVEILGSEIVSVLEQLGPGKYADANAIEAWLACRPSEDIDLNHPFPFGKKQSAVDGWSKISAQGFDTPGVSLPQGCDKKTWLKKSTEPFAENANAARRSNVRFATLLMFKTQYAGRPPNLSIGTVLYIYGSCHNCYLLCLQPKCESVRLKRAKRFPFIRLVPLTCAGKVSKSNSTKSLRLVVEGEDDKLEHFGIDPDLSELYYFYFNPNEVPAGVVRAESGSDSDEFVFYDAGNNRFRWVAQLKDEHALEIAREITDALAISMARPGPNYSEWLRQAHGLPSE